MKRLALIAFAFFTSSGFAATLVSDVQAQMRHTGSGFVDLHFTIVGDEAETFSFRAKDLNGNTNLTIETIYKDDGTAAAPCGRLSPGTYDWVWDAAKDLGGNGELPRVQLEVWQVDFPQYLVADLQGGADILVCGLTEVPADGWSTTYKTAKLVFRRIDGSGGRHDPYYMGVFELTGAQKKYILGTTTSTDIKPAICTFDELRGSELGSQWPQSASVDVDSLVAKVRVLSGLQGIDLPTEGQWDYASRAGVNVGSGVNVIGRRLIDVACCLSNRAVSATKKVSTDRYLQSSTRVTYWENISGPDSVGTKLPNAFGLYDCLGNVSEWCLDWYENGIMPSIDSLGPNTGSERVARGGSAYNIPNCGTRQASLTSQKVPTSVVTEWFDPRLNVSYFYPTPSYTTYNSGGCRLACALSNQELERVIGKTVGVSVFSSEFLLDYRADVHGVRIFDVNARQRTSESGLVDIEVTLMGDMSNHVANAVCTFVATNIATKEALNVAHVTSIEGVAGNGTMWQRRFVWDAAIDVEEIKTDDVALTVAVEEFGGVQLWQDGPYWAECNVGAIKPEEYGYYFCWGDTVGGKRNVNDDGWISAKDSSVFSFNFDNCPTYNKTISQLQSQDYVDSLGNLAAACDAATVHCGTPWRMPTAAEFSELTNNCTITQTTRNSVKGCLFTGRGDFAMKSIFLPSAGFGYDSILANLGSTGSYWSSTPDSGSPGNAWGLTLGSGNSRDNRRNGMSVRPLRGFVNSSTSVATTHFSLDYGVHVTGVSARQRYPWNGLVDLKFTIDGTSGTKYDTSFTAKDVAGGTNLTMKTLYKADGSAANVAKEQLLPGTYNWVWDATADLGVGVVFDRVAINVDSEVSLGGVQLWENGPYWAECNVGATKPEEYGYYFWWGDTVGYSANTNSAIRDGSTWNGVTWVSSKGATMSSSPFNSSICPTFNKTTSQLQSAGYIDSAGNLVAAHDAATAHLGAPWRMPMSAEIDALISNCTTVWTNNWNGTGVNGRLVTGKGAYASKSIFLPAAGFGYDSSLGRPGSYGNDWSSAPGSGGSKSAWSFFFDSGYFDRGNCGSSRGQSVRPVRGFAK